MKLFKDLNIGDDIFAIGIKLQLENVYVQDKPLVYVYTNTLKVTSIKQFFTDDESRTINTEGDLFKKDWYVPTYFSSTDANKSIVNTGIHGVLLFADHEEYCKVLERLSTAEFKNLDI